MPFFRGSRNVDIHGGEFRDIQGSLNEFDRSKHTHYVDSHNTTKSTTTSSFNDSSIQLEEGKSSLIYLRSRLEDYFVVASGQYLGDGVLLECLTSSSSMFDFIPFADSSNRQEQGGFADNLRACAPQVRPKHRPPNDSRRITPYNFGSTGHQSTQPFFPLENSDPFPLDTSLDHTALSWGSNNPFSVSLTGVKPELFPSSKAPPNGKDEVEGNEGN
jgi:hypothetical protein